MSRKILVLGDSGQGKTTSMRNLDPNETIVIQSLNKELPFKGSNKSYSVEKKNKMLYSGSRELASRLKYVNDNTKAKFVIVDDYSSALVSELVNKRNDHNFTVFKDIGYDAVELFNFVDRLRDDLNVVFMAHSEETATGKIKFKSPGKFIEEVLKPEGYFTTLFLMDNEYNFITNGASPSKSPMGLFEPKEPNDLAVIFKKMDEYYG